MKFLIIDDNLIFRQYLGSILTDLLHYQVIETGSFAEAMALQVSVLRTIDVAFIDMKMPLVDGFQSGIQLKQEIPSIVTIMLTAFPSVDEVIKALRDHKFDDFLLKDCLDNVRDLTELKNALYRAKELSVARKALYNEYQLSSALRTQFRNVHNEMIGDSEGFTRIRELISKVASTNTTVLITGETGTGKELVAKEIHRQSRRSHHPFISINCSAIPTGLLESELFGHKKGSFTGAIGNRDGYLKLAEGGTLFLDEIGDMPPDVQSKLLRVLEERQFFPLGSGNITDSIVLDVRIISATHQDIKSETNENKFRKDLLYRLNTLVIHIPPLRDRIDDIDLLVTYFIFLNSKVKRVKGIRENAMQMLKNWHWPGNIRELKNTIERAMMLSDGAFLEKSDFPEEMQQLDTTQEPTRLIRKEITYDNASRHRKNKMGTLTTEKHEPIWEGFKKNDFKLWTFEDPGSIKQQLQSALKGAHYVKKGRSGKLIAVSEFTLKVDLQYISIECEQSQRRTIQFVFAGEQGTSQKHQRSTPNAKHQQSPIVQPVLKGLPDTYLFNLLFPRKHTSNLTSHTPQRIIRATLLRYLLEFEPSSSLKAIFGKTMDFLIDTELVEMIEGLSINGQEAVRAYLCSADNIFSGIAYQIKNDPEKVRKEVNLVFPGFY